MFHLLAFVVTCLLLYFYVPNFFKFLVGLSVVLVLVFGILLVQEYSRQERYKEAQVQVQCDPWEKCK